MGKICRNKNGDYVCLKSECFVYEKNITLEHVKNLTMYNEHYQEMKEWDLVDDYTLDLDNILLLTIRALIKSHHINIDIQEIINLIDAIFLGKFDLAWEKVDKGEITVDEMVTNTILENYKA